MSNETQPTPEQLAKWREEALQKWLELMKNPPIPNLDYVSYSLGYVRAKQEDIQAMKLMEKAANISAQYARKQALEEAIAICYGALSFPDSKNYISDTIKELLK